MKLIETICPKNLFSYSARINIFNDTEVEISFFNKEINDHVVLKITKDLVYTSLSNATYEITDFMNIYAVSSKESPQPRFINKTIESFALKLSGIDYLKRFSLTNFLQIYIPFKDSEFSEWTLRVNSNEPIENAPEEYTIKNSECTEEAFFAITKQYLPLIEVKKIVKENDMYNITTQLRLCGKDCLRSDVLIYAKADSGYIAKSKVLTDENGIAIFKVARLGLEETDDMAVKFGFKYYTNITNAEILP